MDKHYTDYLNNNPREKIAYLHSLIKNNNLTLSQEEKIHHLITKAQIQLQKMQNINQINQGTQNYYEKFNHNNLSLNDAKSGLKNLQNARMMNTVNLPSHSSTTNNNYSLQVQEDINTVQKLKDQYKKKQKEDETNFEEFIKNKKREFLNKQQQRRLEYENALKLFQNQETNALTLFNLTQNYSVQDLKRAYKKQALIHHPDRGGNRENFQYITKCYLLLMERIANPENNFNELKQNYNSDKVNRINPNNINFDVNDRLYQEFNRRASSTMPVNNNNNECRISNLTGQTLDPTNKGFNNALFNKLYEDNKLWNPNDDGYGNIMDSEGYNDIDDYKPEKLFSDKFCVDIFNSTFKEKLNSSLEISKYNDNKQIIKQEPQDLVPATNLNFTELNGDTPIKDFSKPVNSTGDLKGMSFTDYKRAYEKNGVNMMYTVGIKDNRKQYKNVKELKRDRANMRLHMTDKEKVEYQQKLDKEAELELERQKRLRQHDYIYQMHYDKTHMGVLGFADKNDDDIKRLQY